VAATVALCAVLIGAAGGLQHLRDTRFPASAADQETLYITSGKAVSRFTAGYHAIAADLYWVRAIQYYGGRKREIAEGRADSATEDYRLLYPLLDLATTLDPRFHIAYRFGSLFLAEPRPAGPGRPDLAIALLQKGLKERPDKWEYMQDIGFVYYWWLHDYKAAADWFDRGSQVPGAPWWLKSLAANPLTEGGDRRSSRLMWQSIHDSTDNDWLRNDSERRLTQLRAMDEMDALQAIVDRASAERGHPVTDWNELVRAGVIPRTPVDPERTPYEIDAAGKVRMSRQSPLSPLPEEPQRMMAPLQ
jgi:hypothetical protein